MEKENSCTLSVGREIGGAIIEKSMGVPKRLKIELSHPTIWLLGKYTKIIISAPCRDSYTSVFIAA